MKTLMELIPYAEWDVDLDVFDRKYWTPYNKAAVIHRIACLGSAALADTGYQLKQGDEIMGQGTNSKLGNAATAAPEDYRKIWKQVQAYRKNKVWSMFPTVIATTNGIYLLMELTE